jgi:hypothetical protein
MTMGILLRAVAVAAIVSFTMPVLAQLVPRVPSPVPYVPPPVPYTPPPVPYTPGPQLSPGTTIVVPPAMQSEPGVRCHQECDDTCRVEAGGGFCPDRCKVTRCER